MSISTQIKTENIYSLQSKIWLVSLNECHGFLIFNSQKEPVYKARETPRKWFDIHPVMEVELYFVI